VLKTVVLVANANVSLMISKLYLHTKMQLSWTKPGMHICIIVALMRGSILLIVKNKKTAYKSLPAFCKGDRSCVVLACNVAKQHAEHSSGHRSNPNPNFLG